MWPKIGSCSVGREKKYQVRNIDFIKLMKAERKMNFEGQREFISGCHKL